MCSSEEEGYENRVSDVGEKREERPSDIYGEAVSEAKRNMWRVIHSCHRMIIVFKATRSSSADLGRYRSAILGGGRAE